MAGPAMALAGSTDLAGRRHTGANWPCWATAFFIDALVAGRTGPHRAPGRAAGGPGSVVLVLLATIGSHSDGVSPTIKAYALVVLAGRGAILQYPSQSWVPLNGAEAARSAVYVLRQCDHHNPSGASDTLFIAGQEPVPLASLRRTAGQEASWFSDPGAQIRRTSAGGWMEVDVVQRTPSARCARLRRWDDPLAPRRCYAR